MELIAGGRVDVDESASRTRTTLPQELHMDGTTILIIVVLILLLGGGGFYGRGRWYGRR
jgi:hypothetical protein